MHRSKCTECHDKCVSLIEINCIYYIYALLTTSGHHLQIYKFTGWDHMETKEIFLQI